MWWYTLHKKCDSDVWKIHGKYCSKIRYANYFVRVFIIESDVASSKEWEIIKISIDDLMINRKINPKIYI
jgi:hypothetical protein